MLPAAGGAVPATIAVLGGVPHVGLTAEQLQRIAEGGPAVQPSRLNSHIDVDGLPCDCKRFLYAGHGSQ